MSEQAVIKIKLSDLTNEESNVRSVLSEDGMKELTASIKEYGQFVPILVREGGAKQDGTRSYRIIAGHRRVKACTEAGLDPVKAIRIKIKSDEILQVQLIENIQREDMNPMDEATAFEILKKEHKYKHRDIAKMINKTEAYVSNRLSLLKLTDKNKAKVLSGETSVTKAIELAKVKDEKTQDDVADSTEKGTSGDTQAAGRQARAGAGEPPQVRGSKTKTIRSRDEIVDARNLVRDELKQKMEERSESEKVKEIKNEIKHKNKIKVLNDEILSLTVKNEVFSWILVIDTGDDLQDESAT